MIIDGKGLLYKELNSKVRDSLAKGTKELILKNVNGQRYICCGVNKNVKCSIEGVPGNDLGSFMDGPVITVNTNAQDCVGNTMNNGKIVINGSAGDVLGYAMRGGKIFVKGDVGYRVGIHMKSFKEFVPVIVIGGSAGDFLGEYMAGGILILLGMKGSERIAGDYLGTGMHGGVIFVRGKVDENQLGKEVGIVELTVEDKKILKENLSEYCDDFGMDLKQIMSEKFVKLVPKSHRPYGRLYCY